MADSNPCDDAGPVLQPRQTNIRASLMDLDVAGVRDWFKEQISGGNVDKQETADFYHLVIRGLGSFPGRSKAGRQLIYMLNLHGIDINAKNEHRNTALHEYLQSDVTCPTVAEAFLRCNADAYAPNKDGRTAFALAYFNPPLAKQLKTIFMLYVPGLWRAVESTDIMNARKLVNQWSHTEICRDGKSLVQLASESGCDNVLRLIRDITPSMKLAHAVLATDIHRAKDVLLSVEKVNINFHNMSDRGATPLYYAILNNDLPMIELLLGHGARPDIPMTFGDNEIPLFMAALEENQTVDPSTYLTVLQRLSRACLTKMYYLGSNVLVHSMNHGVKCDVIRGILTTGGASLLTTRDQDNLTARDLAELNEKTDYVALIDEVVNEWCTNPAAEDSHRRLLCLHGYPYIPWKGEITPKSQNTPDAAVEARHLSEEQFSEYMRHIQHFHNAVEEGDLGKVNDLIYQERFSRSFEPCFVDSRTKLNWQPALFKAVLRGNRDITRSLVEAYLFLLGQRLDTVRDQFHRTVLHYAMAMEENMAAFLQEHGASEHALDKDGRSPQVFKDRRGQPVMRQLLRYHLLQDFHCPEPDPWSVPLKVPIIGHSEKFTPHHLHGYDFCGHHGHSHSVPQDTVQQQYYTKNTANPDRSHVTYDEVEESETESNQNDVDEISQDYVHGYKSCFIV